MEHFQYSFYLPSGGRYRTLLISSFNCFCFTQLSIYSLCCFSSVFACSQVGGTDSSYLLTETEHTEVTGLSSHRDLIL